MILKKPYAFFIKMFKPLHFLLSALVLYLIYLSNNILKFLSDYMYSAESIVEKDVIKSLVSNMVYVIPVVIIVLFFLLLSIMYKKNKPVVFYFVGIFSFIVVLVINIYTVNFLNLLIENIVSIKIIKLIHDLVLINIILESVSLVFLFIRGIGLDFRRFDFNSDLIQFELNESDKEEFEVNINIDFNERKRKRKEKIRNLKYLYIENKLIINIFVIVSLLLLSGEIIYFVNKYNNVIKEGSYSDTGSFSFKVNNTTITNTDFQGKKITDNYLMIVNTNIKPNYQNQKLHLNDFSLRIDKFLFKPVTKFSDKLIDLGDFYEEQILDFEPADYLFVYEIPEKYISSEMFFRYNKEGEIFEILLNPKETTDKEEIVQTKRISEKLSFEGTLSGIEFKVNNYEIDKYFLLKYKYCIKDNDCILSKEYLKPSIDKNYDKVVIKMNFEYKGVNDLSVGSFYSLLSDFGMISYRVNGKWFNTYDFEEIKSKRVLLENDVYIGINSNILNADSIKLVFNIRGQRYEYILK